MAKGGSRPGAGRKPKPKVVSITKARSATVLGVLGTEIQVTLSDGSTRTERLPTEDEIWLQMLRAPDLRIRLDAIKYLTDRRDGKPPQHINVDLGPDPLLELIGEFRKQYQAAK